MTLRSPCLMAMRCAFSTGGDTAEQGGKIIVETVADGGNGKAADIEVGDIVRATTARSKASYILALGTLCCYSKNNITPQGTRCTATGRSVKCDQKLLPDMKGRCFVATG